MLNGHLTEVVGVLIGMELSSGQTHFLGALDDRFAFDNMLMKQLDLVDLGLFRNRRLLALLLGGWFCHCPDLLTF